MSVDSSPDISVVVCTYNRAEMLRETLASLAQQQTEARFQFEMVVVDNASTDNTADVLAAAQPGSAVAVRHIREPRQGQVYARNRGIAEARGQWIANFDDDQVADPRWLLELYALAQEHQAISVGGAVRLRLPDDCGRQLSPVCRRLLGESVDWDTPRPYTRKEGPGSGNQMLHRDVFARVGLYDDSYNLRGYDTDLYRRIRAAGIESWYTPSAVAWHITPPYRLDEKYLRDTSLHNGWCFARRDYQEWGRLALVAVLVARVGQAVCLNLPRWAWARVARAREDAVAARCLFWRLQGYGQCALDLLKPRRVEA